MFCSRSLIRRLATVTRKRFYKNVSIVSANSDLNGVDAYEICLDKKKLRTPKGAVLQIPSEALSLAVSQEWMAQKESLDISNMRLTGLAITATDNPMELSKEIIAQQILQYLETDTVFYMCDEPEKLRQLQELHWGEVIDWARKRHKMDIEPTRSILEGPQISAETRKTIERHLLAYDFWSLIGYQYCVEPLKSLLITMATLNSQISVEDAVKMSTLESRFQTQTWGRVEWAHDMEFSELCARAAAGLLFVQLNSNSERNREIVKR